jgi:hypothetical protein
VRVRQASIAPQLRQEPTAEQEAEETVTLSPDRVRRMMSSYQRGTRRGRAEAERLDDNDQSGPSPSEEPPTGADR